MAINRTSPKKGKVVDIPTAPTIGTATVGAESASTTFTNSTVGGPYRSYIAKSNPSNITATGSTSPIIVTGLTEGTPYTISIAGVNETGTGEYSSASNSVTPTAAVSYESIATVTLSSSQSNIEFTSIPATFKHLQIRGILKSTVSPADTDYGYFTFNSDTGSNYSYHRFQGNGTTTGSSGTSSGNYGVLGYIVPSTGRTNIFGTFIMDILDYVSTSKIKTAKILSGLDNNGSGIIEFNSASWRDTSAINSIRFISATGNLAQYSSLALYGIKG